MDSGYEIKLLERENEIDEAIKLAEEVFTEFEAPIYPKEGADSFYSFLYGENMRKMRSEGSIHFFGAYCGGVLAGICAHRKAAHITLMFVRREFQRKGIGRALMEAAIEHIHLIYGTYAVTLNAAPCGIEFYKRIGFIPTDMEQMADGIIFTPMVYCRQGKA